MPQSLALRAQEAQPPQAQREALDAAAPELARPAEPQQEQVFQSAVPGLVAAAIQPAFLPREAPRPAELAE
jgi:hypothetical protein